MRTLEGKAPIAEATVKSKGQITVPGAVRKLLHLSTGDRLRFVQSTDGSIFIEARRRRSILDIARENPLPAPRLRNLDAKINAAVGEAMVEQEQRVRARSGR